MSLRLLLVNFVLLMLPVAFCNDTTIHNNETLENNLKFFPVYVFDNRKAQRLALLEEHFYDSLSRDRHRFEHLPSCHSQIAEYLTDFERDLISCNDARGETKAINIVQNPFLMFRQIRRIYQTLLHDVATSCEGHAKVKENVKKLFNYFDIPEVIEPDLDYAMRGIIRLQYIYGFNASRDLRKGIIGGVDTGVFLSMEDCAVLAKAALDIYEARILAFQWLMAAEEIHKEEGLNDDEDTNTKLADAWTRLKNLTQINTKRELKQKFNSKIQKSLNRKEGLDDYDYYSTCRGESFQTQEELSQRFCYYESAYHPYLLLNPAKIEYISFDPVILQIYDIVNPSANSYIMKHLSETMMPGTADNGKSSQREASPLKNRMESEIQNLKHPEVLRMYVKEETLTGLRTIENVASLFIASKYNSFGYLTYHYDVLAGRLDLDLTEIGDRILTVIYYFTDVEHGGATSFPEVGVWATPVANSALFWFNLDERGYPDMRMLHGACPVLFGTKTIGTKWIYQNDNIFNKPCPLHAAPKLKK